MIATHNDLGELSSSPSITTSSLPSQRFPIFSPEQIRRLNDISIPRRRHILQEWGVEDPAMAHFLDHFHDHPDSGPG